MNRPCYFVFGLLLLLAYWSSTVLLADDRRVGPGDTAGLAAAADGTFHPLWVDHRTGTPQVWTATVTVTKKP